MKSMVRAFRSPVSFLAGLTAALTSLAGGAVATADAYEPPMGASRTDFGAALIICQPLLKKSPGEVPVNDYYSYVQKRDDALKADPKLKDWDVKYLGQFVPKELFPKCEKLMADFVAGVEAEKKPTLAMSCEHNVNGRLDAIIEKYYPDLQAKGPAGVIVWFARKDLEAARWMMYRKGGFKAGSATCAPNDPFKKAFAPLKDKLTKAEALVKKMETAKGIRFEKLEEPNHVVFIDLKTGKPVAKPDQY